MEALQQIFIDKNGAIRSGWRIAVFVLAYFLAAGMSAAISLAVFAGSDMTTPESILVNAVFMLIPALIVGALCGKYLEHLPFSAIGVPVTKRAGLNLVLGSVAGAATLGFAVAIAMAFGGLAFSRNPESVDSLWYALVVPLIVFGAAAAMEEALFRGYIFQTLERSGYAWLAIALTAVPFGIVHLGNPNAGAISTINTVLAGVWFGLAYLKTRDLWFVWGVHWFWNWTQGSIFGIEVSGLTQLSATPLLLEQDTGPHWLTGTTYGIEGGIACTIALIVSTIAIHYIPGRTNHIET